MTITEKVLARASGQKKTSPGEYVTAKIDMAMMPEMFRLLQTVLSRGGIREDAIRIWDPERFVVVIDHRVPPAVLANAENQKICREFAKKLKRFRDVHDFITLLESLHKKRILLQHSFASQKGF